MNETEICLAALDRWGGDLQTLVLFEEMAELQKALCKFARGSQNEDAIAEEIADVTIMLHQMILLHDCNAQVESWKEWKLARLQKRLSDGKEDGA